MLDDVNTLTDAEIDILMQLVSSAKCEMAEYSIGIIVAHLELAPNYVHFALKFSRFN